VRVKSSALKGLNACIHGASFDWPQRPEVATAVLKQGLFFSELSFNME
jgi:hypothetical protein